MEPINPLSLLDPSSLGHAAQPEGISPASSPAEWCPWEGAIAPEAHRPGLSRGLSSAARALVDLGALDSTSATPRTRDTLRTLIQEPTQSAQLPSAHSANSMTPDVITRTPQPTPTTYPPSIDESMPGTAAFFTSNGPLAGMPAYFSTLLPMLLALKSLISEELESNLPKLLALNPSRREAIAQYLDKLTGHAPGPSTLAGNADAAGGLRRWIEGPRSPAQTEALRAYFEEIAILTLGQALLFKSWADRGLRAWSDADLGKLNWALSSALKPHVPLDREGWQVTKPNLYSWYYPGPALQREINTNFEGWRITDEGPLLLSALLGPTRQAHPEGADPFGYDPRFFKMIWSQAALHGFDSRPDSGPMKRARVAFSPTLRDGTVARTGPSSLHWVGLESSPFLIMMAELAQLWWGPSAPPFWAVGNGLEAHSRDQLPLSLGSPKPSLLARITDMEACDLAFVLEEQALRTQSRSAEAQRLRLQLEQLPYFKKLRTATTTLGDLQACVALSKLRPGGILWWAREEALSASDGTEVLNFLLDRGRLVCEWDFSELSHALPAKLPLFPKHLYLFSREPEVEKRMTHRPLRVALQGQIRSHVEVEQVLVDALSAQHRPAENRAHWKCHVIQSPVPQKDWAERWPDPASRDALRGLERLRAVSLPLASATTVRSTPDGDPERDGSWTVHASLQGFWLQADHGPDGRRLRAMPLPKPGEESRGTGFLVLVADAAWIAPLCRYLESPSVRNWLDHYAERRGDRWILKEQTVKWLPIPRMLLACLGASAAFDPSLGEPLTGRRFDLPLPGDWERMAAELSYRPELAREALARLGHEEHDFELRTAIFVRATRALDQAREESRKLVSVVATDGSLRWRKILDILPQSECVAISIHPKLKMTGNLPPHLAIGRIERIKMPAPGIMFATESGFFLSVHSESPMALDMLWEQLEGIQHPTWTELLRYLKLPRRLEFAEATASDILRAHGEKTQKIRALEELIAGCALY